MGSAAKHHPKRDERPCWRLGLFRTAQLLRGGQWRTTGLGRIIFRFPNKFSVYLHDTSSPSAFNRESRTVSHGCVRLQRPFDIAEFVLHDADPWLLDKMRLSMDLQPKTEQGKQYKKQHKN